MQADQRDAVARNRKSLQESLNRRDMGVGHVALEFELRGLGFAQVRDHRAQALGHVPGVREGRGGPGFELRFAVAFDQRDVDPVHRRAADDPDREENPLAPHSPSRDGRLSTPYAGRGLG
jgi:hypothetical protein